MKKITDKMRLEWLRLRGVWVAFEKSEIEYEWYVDTYHYGTQRKQRFLKLIDDALRKDKM